ncbi:hypothetical protein HON01_03450, partial [Candidatus Woesearchaeota archaeon]|nr:hypothetical protein [Candidatus Woesearchaeota archaeon]
MDKTKQTNTKKPIDQESQKVIDLEVKEVQKVIDQEVQGTQEVIDQADLDLTKYVILEGKSQGNYEYPDLLVSIDLLTIGQAWSTIKQDEAHLNHYNITLERKNDPLTCITWNQAHKILDGLENKLIENKKPVMLNPKQFID